MNLFITCQVDCEKGMSIYEIHLRQPLSEKEEIGEILHSGTLCKSLRRVNPFLNFFNIKTSFVLELDMSLMIREFIKECPECSKLQEYGELIIQYVASNLSYRTGITKFEFTTNPEDFTKIKMNCSRE